MKNLKGLEQLKKEMEIPPFALRAVAGDFKAEMEAGLAGKPGSLKMLPSYLGIPTGEEKGTFLALDFGGTNVRLMTVSLLGGGIYEIERRVSFSLKDEKRGIDFTSSCASGECLFDHIAAGIKAFAGDGRDYRLGHTFSFPFHSGGINHAELIKWTKEFETRETAGKDVQLLLKDALKRQGVNNVKPVAVINDTVGTLLAAAYRNKRCDLGSILGTGHNTCYLESNTTRFGRPVIINIEAGNFGRVPLAPADRVLDAASEIPGEQILEKMVAGKYLGRLMWILILDLNEKGIVFPGHDLKKCRNEAPFSTEDVSKILGDETDGLVLTGELLESRLAPATSVPADRQVVRETARLLRNRSARLAAATYLAVLEHMDPILSGSHVIAVDGTLYEKMPGYASTLGETLKDLLGDKHEKVELRLVKDASGAGAAVAAAMA
ncbi:MAG: hexokinase [Peptococcaceae bacterium]|jgi:hexokinase|nr:hexokinase [Peptococcaceae bacterium]MDH7524487.1 hexokinase [Peptococcaceae bacterium]